MNKVSKKGKSSKSKATDKFSFLTKSFVPYLLLSLITFVVYFQVLSFGLIEFDDLQIIERAKNHSEENIFKTAYCYDSYFKADVNSNYYRPVQNLTILIDSSISNDGYTSYHFSNLLFHLFAVLALFNLMKKLKTSGLAALFASLIFAVHPLFSFNVAWIPARGDMLSTFFSLLSLIFFIRYIEKHKITDIALNVTFMFLAVLSKEIAVVLPVLFALYFILLVEHPGAKIKSIRLRDMIILVSGWSASILIYFILKSLFLNQLQTQFSFGFSEFFNNLRYFPEYFAKTFIPINISGMSSFDDTRLIAGFILIVALPVLAMIKKESTTTRKVVFSYLWIIIFLLPVISFKPVYIPTGENWEHRAYLPMLGLFILISDIAAKYFKQKEKLLLTGSAIVIIFAVLTIGVSKNYSNPFSYFDNIIKKGNELPNAYFGRGTINLEKQNTAFALNDFNRAIELKDDYYEAYFKRGIIENETNQIDKAVKDFLKAAELKPELPHAYFNLSICYYKLNDYQQSYNYMEKSMAIDPSQPRGNEILTKLKELIRQPQPPTSMSP